jgi:hypothetical protein
MFGSPSCNWCNTIPCSCKKLSKEELEEIAEATRIEYAKVYQLPGCVELHIKDVIVAEDMRSTMKVVDIADGKLYVKTISDTYDKYQGGTWVYEGKYYKLGVNYSNN